MPKKSAQLICPTAFVKICTQKANKLITKQKSKKEKKNKENRKERKKIASKNDCNLSSQR